MKNDVREFQKIYNQYYPVMVGFACRFVEREIAEDLVQDVFLSFWEEEREIGKVASYLLRTVQNKCLNHIKHKSVEEKYQAHVLLANERLRYIMEKSDDNSIYKHLDRSELRELLIRKLAELPEKQYYACYKHFFEGYSAKELAEELDMSVRSIEGYFYTGVLHLRKELKSPLSFIFMLFSII